MKVTVVHWEGFDCTYTDIEVPSTAELSRYIRRLNKDTELLLDCDNEGPSCLISKSKGLNYLLEFIPKVSDIYHSLINHPVSTGTLFIDVEDMKPMLDIGFKKTLQAATYFFEHGKMDPSLAWAVNYAFYDYHKNFPWLTRA